MIIDSTYFINRLNLPQTGNSAGLAEVQAFIDQYEPEYLQCVLGFDLWQAFINGIDGSGLPEQRWIDLLQGKEFTKQNRTYLWRGFAPLTEGATYSIDSSNFQDFTAGGPGEFDPVSGATVMTMPPEFVGAVKLNVYIRGTGWLKAPKPTAAGEFSVAGDQLTLLGGLQFNSGTVVFLQIGPRLAVVSGSVIKLSPIANYVFYQFVDERVIDFTLVGNVKSTTENNRIADEAPRLVYTWNRMVDMNRLLYNFLKVNKITYPEWKSYCGCGCAGYYWDECSCCSDMRISQRCCDLFKYKNSLGL